MLLPKSPKLYGSDHPVVPSNIKESAKQVADLQVISIGICLTPMLSDGRRLICSLQIAVIEYFRMVCAIVRKEICFKLYFMGVCRKFSCEQGAPF
jgi:hypothetical protein